MKKNSHTQRWVKMKQEKKSSETNILSHLLLMSFSWWCNMENDNNKNKTCPLCDANAGPGVGLAVEWSSWRIVLTGVGVVVASLQVEGSLRSTVMFVEKKDKVMWLLGKRYVYFIFAQVHFISSFFVHKSEINITAAQNIEIHRKESICTYMESRKCIHM